MMAARILPLRFRRSRRGSAAVEFAIVAPLVCLLVAAAVDFGGALYTKLKLDSAVAAGANYAQVNAANISSADGAALATNIAVVVEANKSAPHAGVVVVVNNGPTVTMREGAAVSSGAAENADKCYCPTGSLTSLAWGLPATCGSVCAGGGIAGKFVTITASLPYTPTFSSYGFVRNHTVSTSAVVQAQ